MKQLLLFQTLLLATAHAVAQPTIIQPNRSGDIALTKTYTNGVCAIQKASLVTGP